MAEGGTAAEPSIARVDGRHPPERGSTVNLTVAPDRVHLFDPRTGRRPGG